jgi:hypothetical protein
MTLGHLMKVNQPDEVMLFLKEFSNEVDIKDKVAKSELSNLISKISSLIVFHNKFEKTIDKMGLKERYPESVGSDYVKNWKSFSWLLYVQAKNKILGNNRDPIDHTCMLASSLAFMLIFAWDYLIPTVFLKEDKNINEQSSGDKVTKMLFEKVQAMFHIKQECFAPIFEDLKNFFEHDLLEKKIIKSIQGEDFFSPECLSNNYLRLDKLYQKSMGPNDFDEQTFLRGRLPNLTPSKFTPFARQGYANKGRKTTHNNDITYKENYSSHRILNYEMMDKVENNIKNTENFNLSKLPKAVLKSPVSTMKVNLICQTPITTGMEMFNYVHEKTRKLKELLTQGVKHRVFEKDMYQFVQSFVEIDKKNCDRKTKESR